MSVVSKLRRVIRWTTGAFGALLVLGVLTLFLLDLSRFRAGIESVASESLQRRVGIAGEIRLVPGLHPTIVVRDVRVANPAWATTPDLVHIADLELVVTLHGLLGGALDVREARAKGFEVHLETGPQGQQSWVFDGLGDAAPSFAGTLSLSDGRLSFRQAGSGSPLEIAVPELGGVLREDQPLSLNARLLVRERPLSIRVDGGTLADLVNPSKPWPVQIAVDADQTTLRADGSIAKPETLSGIDLQLGLETAQLSSVGEPFGLALPTLGAANIQGRLSGNPTQLRLSELVGKLEENTVTGEFELDRSSTKPRLIGRVHADRLRLEVLGAVPYAATVQAESVASREELLGRALDVPMLNTLDVELSSSVAQVYAGDRNLGPRTGRLTIEDSVLALDVRFGPENDAAVQLHVTLDGTGESLALTLELEVDSIPYGEVLERWQLAESVSGTAEHLKLRLQGAGSTVRALLDTANLDLVVRNTGFEYAGWDWSSTPTHIADASLRVRGGGIEIIAANGNYDEQSFDVSLSARSIDVRDIEKPWPIDLAASLGDHSLTAKGTVTRIWRDHEVDVLATLKGRVKVPGSNAGGDASLTVVPYMLNARLTGNPTGHQLAGLRGEVGASDLDGALSIADTASGGYKLSGNLHSEELAVAQLGALLFAAAGGDDSASPEPLELEFLHDNEFDVQLSADKLSETLTAVSELRARVIAGAGRLSVEPLALRFAGLPLSGRAMLDGTKAQPSVSFDLTADATASHKLRGGLGPARDVALDAERLHVAGQGAGKTWPELWNQLALNLDASRVRLVFRDDDSPGAILELERAEAHTQPGAPTSITAAGRYRQVPFELEATTGAMVAPEPQTGWPVALRFRAHDTALDVDGELGAPLDLITPKVRWSLQGQRTETLERLLGWPPLDLGAYSVSGTLTSGPNRYELKNLETVVGRNNLAGHAQFNTGSRPVQVSAELQSSYLDIDGLVNAPQDTTQTASTSDTMIANPTLFPTLPADFHAQVTLGMEQVIIAGFELRDASVKTQIEHGQLIAGKHQGTFSTGGSFEFHHRMDADGTHLAFRAYPLNLGGIFEKGDDGPVTATWPADIEIDLEGQGVTLHELLASSDGHISFTAGALEGTNAYIDRIRTGLIEIMFPRLLGRERARMNCLVVDLRVENGTAKTEKAVYDTSTATVFISGDINLETEAVNLTLVPRPKNPGLFDVATPVRMGNTLADPRFSVAAGEVALSASALPIRAPLRLPIISSFVNGRGDDRDPCITALQGDKRK